MDRKFKIKKLTFKSNDKYITVINKSVKKINEIRMTKILQKEFEIQRREDKSYKNKFDRHIEHLELSEEEISIRAIHKNPTIEEIILANETIREIIREIWSLPIPQNRRVYMYIVDGLSYTEISRIELRDVSVIKRSVDAGIKNLQKKLKNF